MDPIKLIIVGAGDRSMIYGREALSHPDLFQIVGVADPNPQRVQEAREVFHIPEDHCFTSAEALTQVPKFADGVINGTLDLMHVDTTIPLLHHGYDVLLEKPFATNLEDAERLLKAVRETGRKVMVCHVLRYTPFYQTIKKLLAQGTLGDVINIQMSEQVSYFHESVSYVRGKYADPAISGSGMLLAKSSHDIDLMTWLMGDVKPVTVSSMGSVFQFRRDHAPEKAGTHCLTDCPLVETCPYSAKVLYLDHPQRWANNIWHDYNYHPDTYEEKAAFLADPANAFGRCVYDCDIKVVDHQSVLFGFENGACGGFSMNGGAAGSGRLIHITATKGELKGRFEDEAFTLELIDPAAPGGKRTEQIRTDAGHDAHGGGDQRLIRDFVSLLRDGTCSISTTLLEDSFIGHKAVFLAEKSRENGGEMIRF